MLLRNEKSLAATSKMFKLKLEALWIFNERLKIRNIKFTLAQQIDDYAYLIKEKYSSDKKLATMYQNYFSQKFYESEWGHLYQNIDKYKKKIKANYDRLVILKQKYKKLFPFIMPSADLNLDDFYEILKSEMMESLNSYVEFSNLDLEVLHKKGKSIIEMAIESIESTGMMPSPKIKPKLTEMTRDKSLQIAARDLYVKNRELTFVTNNIVRFVFEYFKKNKLPRAKLNKIKSDLREFKQRLNTVKSLDEYQDLMKEIEKWKNNSNRATGQFLEDLQDAYQSIKQSSVVVLNFKASMARLRNTIMNQMVKFKNKKVKPNVSDEFNLLIKCMENLINGLATFDKSYLENNFKRDFARIEAAYNEDKFNMKQLRGLGVYLNQIKNLQVHETDWCLLVDLNTLYSLSMQFHTGTGLSANTFHYPILSTMMGVSSAVSELEQAKLIALNQLNQKDESQLNATNDKSHAHGTKQHKLSLDLRGAKPQVDDMVVETMVMPTRRKP